MSDGLARAGRRAEVAAVFGAVLPAHAILFRSEDTTPCECAGLSACRALPLVVLRAGPETHLNALGFSVRVASRESHLCCGSAGTYSVLQPKLAYPLRDRKLTNLAPLQPQAFVSANIDCIRHLQTGTATPVKHGVVVLDEALLAALATSA